MSKSSPGCQFKTTITVVMVLDYAACYVLLQHGEFLPLGCANEILAVELQHLALGGADEIARREDGRREGVGSEQSKAEGEEEAAGHGRCG